MDENWKTNWIYISIRGETAEFEMLTPEKKNNWDKYMQKH